MILVDISVTKGIGCLGWMSVDKIQNNLAEK